MLIGNDWCGMPDISPLTQGVKHTQTDLCHSGILISAPLERSEISAECTCMIARTGVRVRMWVIAVSCEYLLPVAIWRKKKANGYDLFRHFYSGNTLSSLRALPILLS